MADPIDRLARAVFARSPDVAHDLKTPLNIVVLNVELLKMRLRKLSEEIGQDEKIDEHCRSLEREARRVATIADSFLAIARLPENDTPQTVDAGAVVREKLQERGFRMAGRIECRLTTFPTRVERAATLLAEGIAGVLDPADARVDCSVGGSTLTIVVEAPPRLDGIEFGKLFKFYYTDPSGEPNPSLASARLLLETMGGALDCETEGSTVRFKIELQGEE